MGRQGAFIVSKSDPVLQELGIKGGETPLGQAEGRNISFENIFG